MRLCACEALQPSFLRLVCVSDGAFAGRWLSLTLVRGWPIAITVSWSVCARIQPMLRTCVSGSVLKFPARTRVRKLTRYQAWTTFLTLACPSPPSPAVPVAA